MSWLDFAPVNIFAIADSKNKDIKIQQGIDYSVVTDAVPAKPGKLTFQHMIGFRVLHQFILNEAKDSFCLERFNVIVTLVAPIREEEKSPRFQSKILVCLQRDM